MAMLAEPRQRKRYNLTPRGKALYEDESRFGTKMLEKMGWSKGKGLGANENGSQDFVRVRMRNTNEGLGYEERDDHWTQHEQDFNGLLNSLNGASEESAKASVDKESASDEDAPRVGFGFAPEQKKSKVEKFKDKISGISLEEKSKLSKARVHYQKFTKGKDIAQYSEKDLANIFGKKAVETDNGRIYAEFKAFSLSQKTKEDEKSAAADKKDVKSNFGGVQIINAGLSVSDYFKQKMEVKKSRQKQNFNANNEQNDNAELEEVQLEEVTVEIKKKTKRKREEAEVEPVKKSNSKIETNQTAEDIELKMEYNGEKREKRKKFAVNAEPTNDIKLNDANTQEAASECKKSKKKKKLNAMETVDLTVDNDIEDAEPLKKKKKKSKENIKERRINEKDLGILENEALNINNQEINKEAQMSKGSIASQHYNEAGVISSEEKDNDEPRKKNKLKKSKDEKLEAQLKSISLISDDEHPTIHTSKKKKQKIKIAQDNKNCHHLTEMPIDQDSLGEVVLKKSKIPKNKERLEENILIENNEPDKEGSEIVQPTAEISSVPSGKKSKKQKQREKDSAVSIADAGSKNQAQKKQSKKCVSEDICFQTLTLDELIAKCNSFNVLTVSSFCAEKFRHVDLDRFKGSTLSQLPGYSYNELDLKLNVEQLPSDEQRIIQLWNCTINKYQEAKPRAVFGKYKSNAIKVFKSENKKQRLPRFYMKSLKRKNVFQPI